MVSVAEGTPLRTACRQVQQLLEQAACPDADFDARVLVGLAVGQQRWFDRDVLTAEQARRLTEYTARRCRREPLQYICGSWPFLNFSVRVGPGVLCPRADTELLAECAAACIREVQAPQVLDLCAGTGCVALAVKALCPAARVTAVEKSPEAFVYLSQNAVQALPGMTVMAQQGDLFTLWQSLPEGSLDLITANPPYLTAEEMRQLQPEVAREPAMALAAGEDGLDFYRALARDYLRALRPGGWMALEIGWQQRQAVETLLAEHGWTEIRCEKDLGGCDRCVLARRPEKGSV